MSTIMAHDAGATFDATRRYRYRLWRDWGGRQGRVLFIMLNPSTADAVRLDPTIRRCIGFAESWGFGGIDVVNLFAWRATDPRALARARDPVGGGNDAVIAAALRDASLAVAAWGGDPLACDRANDVRRLARRLRRSLFCIGHTISGQPRHPLYVRGDARPEIWQRQPRRT